MGYYKGQNGPEVIKEAESNTNGFKKGGRAKKASGGSSQVKGNRQSDAHHNERAGSMFKRGGKAAPMMGADAKHHAGRNPRKSGGAVFSTAAKSEPRKN